MWGTGASSTQCEGAAPASDWWQWERDGHAPPSGDGNGFAARYAEDFALLAGLGLTPSPAVVRMGPARARARRARPAAVAPLPSGARRPPTTPASSPWVCLHHFTLPRWFAGAGRLPRGAQPHRASGPARRLRRRHVRRSGRWVAAGQRDELLRPRRLPRRRLAAGARRPGRGGGRRRGDPPRHRRGRGAPARTGAPVASIFGFSPIVPRTTTRDRRKAAHALRHHWAPGIGLFRDGVLAGARAATRSNGPTSPGSFDLIGFSYYAAMGVSGGAWPSTRPMRPCRRSATASGPTGSVSCSTGCHAELPDTPLLVAEYGIGTDDDGSGRGT